MTIVHSLILQLFIEAVTQVVEGVSNICTIIKSKIKPVIVKHVSDMATKLDTIETIYDEGKPLGPSWA